MKRIFERPIQISSINREKSGISRPDDFVIRFTPPLQLPEDMYHEIALNKVNMTYSWYNITNEYKNKTIKYSPDSGSTWKKIIFADGNYDYDDLNNFIKETLDNNGDGHPNKKKSNIEITFIRSQLKVLIGLSAGFKLDLRGSKFAELIGFQKKLVDKEEIASKLPNITNSIDVINLNSDVITDSLVNGISSNTLKSTEDLESSFPFTYHPPINWLFNPVSSNYIQIMNFYLRDVLNRPINLNGIDWYLELVLRSTPKY